MPNDPHCMLHNIYGSDYMTPKSGKSSQAKWGTQHGKPAYDNPKCNSTLTTFEERELERQLGNRAMLKRNVKDSEPPQNQQLETSNERTTICTINN